MHKYLQRLLFFEKFEFQTKLSKQDVLRRIEPFTRRQYDGYSGRIKEDRFIIARDSLNYSGMIRTRNSFAPVAEATVTEENGITTISGILRLNRFVQIFLYLGYFPMLVLTIFAFPFPLIIWTVFYLAFL